MCMPVINHTDNYVVKVLIIILGVLDVCLDLTERISCSKLVFMSY